MISITLLFLTSIANASGFTFNSGDIEKIRSTMATANSRLTLIALEKGEAMCTRESADIHDFHCLVGEKAGLGNHTLTDEIVTLLDQEMTNIHPGDSTELDLPYPTQARVACSVSEENAVRAYMCEFLD